MSVTTCVDTRPTIEPMQLMVVWALDHFSTDDEDEVCCVAQFVGLDCGVVNGYRVLRHVLADVNRGDAAAEYHKVLESAIVAKQVFDVDSVKIDGVETELCKLGRCG